MSLELEREDIMLSEIIARKKIALFDSDALLKLFYKKEVMFNVKLRRFRAWKNKVIPSRNETLTTLQNVKNNMQVEYDYLAKELEEKKQIIEKIKEEYEILKKNFCRNCLQEEPFISLQKSNEFCILLIS